MLEFKSPFIEALDPAELQRLQAIDFNSAVPPIRDYWRRRLAERTQIVTSERSLDDFYRANLWHILITTDRDPETGLDNQGVGTVQYRVFANETVMVARYLDLVGEHREAERFLEPMLHYQGQEALTGRFSTKEGSIYPDTQCFAEWVRRFGQGGGPVYKTSDESRFLVWLRLRHPQGLVPNQVQINDQPISAAAVHGENILIPLIDEPIHAI